MGKDPAATSVASPSGDAGESVAPAEALPADADHDHVGGELDAAAVAALQQLGTDAGLAMDVTGDHALAGDQDIVAALHGADVASNLDHALDQLTSSADLFDMPALDFGDHSGSAHP